MTSDADAELAFESAAASDDILRLRRALWLAPWSADALANIGRLVEYQAELLFADGERGARVQTLLDDATRLYQVRCACGRATSCTRRSWTRSPRCVRALRPPSSGEGRRCGTSWATGRPGWTTSISLGHCSGSASCSRVCAADPVAALAALWTLLGKNAGEVHRWRLDSAPKEPYDWNQYVSAEAVAKVMRASVQLGALRVALSAGSPLSTWSVWNFVRSHVPSHEAALHIAGQSAKRPCRFRWPLRIGYLPGPTAEADVAALALNDYWNGNVFTPGVLSRRRLECDVLVWSGPSSGMAQDDISRAVEELDGVLADMVLLFDTSAGLVEPDLPALDKIRASVGASGIALVPGASLHHAQATSQLCVEISHNHPIDVALSLASSGQALLMASRQLLEASWLQNKARSVARALTHTAQAHLTADPNVFGPWAEFVPEAASAADPGLDWQAADDGGSGGGDGDAGDGGGAATAPRLLRNREAVSQFWRRAGPAAARSASAWRKRSTRSSGSANRTKRALSAARCARSMKRTSRTRARAICKRPSFCRAPRINRSTR